MSSIDEPVSQPLIGKHNEDEARLCLPDEDRLHLAILPLTNRPVALGAPNLAEAWNSLTKHSVELLQHQPGVVIGEKWPLLSADPGQSGAYFILLSHRCGPPLVDVLIASHGMLNTLQAVMFSCRFSASEDDSDRPDAKFRSLGLLLLVRHLRRRIQKCTLKEQEENRCYAEGVKNPTPSQEMVLAYLLPEVSSLRTQALRGRGPALHVPLCALLVELVESASELEELAPWLNWVESAALITPVLHRLGLPAANTIAQGLIRGLDARPWERNVDDEDVARLLLAIPIDTSLSYLFAHLDSLPFFVAAAKATHLYPVRLLRLLAPIAASKGRGRKHETCRSLALLLMNAAAAAHPEAIAIARKSWSSGIVKRLPCDLRLSRIPVAATADEPKVLQRPPEQVPDWAIALPALVFDGLRGEEARCLSRSAMDTLLTVLSAPDLKKRQRQCVELKKAFTDESLGRFSWALFESWRRQGQKKEDGWAFEQLAFLGDDVCAERLASLLRNYSYSERSELPQRETTVLLSSMRTKNALLWLSDVHLFGKRAPPRYSAQYALDSIAKARGRTRYQLVVEQTFPEPQPVQLGYGGRGFLLRLIGTKGSELSDEGGGVLAALPATGPRDDPRKVEAAQERYRSSLQHHQTAWRVLTRTIERLHRERWEAADFVRLIVKHPRLTGYLPRLLWGQFADSEQQTEFGGLTGTLPAIPVQLSFRVSSEGTFVDCFDEDIQLGEGPVSLLQWSQIDSKTQAAWRQQLVDYEIVQPFEQVTPSDEMR